MARSVRALALLATAAFLLLCIPFLVLTTLYVLSGIVAPVPGLAVLIVSCVLIAGLIGFWSSRPGAASGDVRRDRGSRHLADRLGQGVALLATIVFLSLSVPFVVLTAATYLRSEAALGGPAVVVVFVYAIAIVALGIFWARRVGGH